MKKNIKAIIPVRAGSERIKNKNIKPFANSSLLEIKIKQLLNIKELDGVIVNSDSDEMLSIASRLGAEIIKRDKYYASNNVPINEVYVNLAQNCDADVILLADVTNPLIKDKTIQKAIDIFYSYEIYDSINTVNTIKMFLWKDGKELNYSENNKPRSQDLPNIYAINSAINILFKETMIKKKSFIGYNPYFLPVSSIEGIDIDTEIDFKFAEFIYKRVWGWGKTY